MVCWLIENEKIRPGEERAAKRDAPSLAAGQGRDLALRIGRVQVGDQALDPMLEIPTGRSARSARADPLARAFRRSARILGSDPGHAARPTQIFARTLADSSSSNTLRHVADDEIAPPVVRSPASGGYHTRGDLQKVDFAGAVAPDQPDALAFQNR